MDKIIIALKNARKTLGLSQSELSKRVGVPQSHISKIESGKVDIQLSSLRQLARALDFELQLIPKKALPAVQSIVRSTKPQTFGAMYGAGQEIIANSTLPIYLDDGFEERLTPDEKRQILIANEVWKATGQQ